MPATRTHLSPTTGKREPCTASKRACRFSSHQDVEPSVDSMTEFYAEVPAAAYANITNAAVHHALTADLNYSGPKPSWWAGHEAEAADHPKLPTSVQLLDVIDTPAGKVAVVWQETSHAENDMGVILDSGMGVHACRYLDYKTGKSLGYVKLSYMDTATIERSFGNDEFTPFRHKQRYGGGNLGLTDYDAPDQEPFWLGGGPDFTDLEGQALLEKRREVWLKVHQSGRRGYAPAGKEHIPSYQLGAADVPDGATVAKELEVLGREFQREVDADLTYFNRPFVDFSRVEGKLGGKGYGSALYIYAARFLAARNQVVRGSGLQSDSAQALWSRFAQQLPQHFKPVQLVNRGRKSITPTLDFRP